ncbi:MAG: enoyl-CoA hydratase [Candidatus Hydrogenedentota bacterium]
MSSDAIVSVENSVGTITLNRPDSLNALSGEMVATMRDTLTEWARDSEIGAVILTGEGRAFCAGGDVGSMAKGTEQGEPGLSFEQRVDGLRAGQEVAYILHSMPKPTIAAVNGFAVGAGLGLSLSCDMRIASDKSKYGTAYAKVGFGGDWGTTWQLTQLVGEAKAKEMFFLADIIDAEEAHRINLVNRVVPHDDLMTTTNEIAQRMADGARVSIRYMKENINLAVRQDFRTILDREAFTHIRCGETDDHKEGATAFVEKRAPVFTGR